MKDTKALLKNLLRLIHFGANVLISAFVVSSYALADPKSDIDAYNKAYEIGDDVKGDALLKIAFENAKKNLNSDDKYLMKISYDLSLNSVISEDPSKAIEAAKILRAGLKSNAAAFESSDKDELQLILSIIEVFPLTKNRNDYSAFSNLSSAIKSFEKAHPNDVLLLHAYSAYCAALREAWRWAKLAYAADDLVKYSEKLEKTPNINSQRFRLLGLYYRGQAKFATSISKQKISGISNLKGFEDSPYWETALADIISALDLYGKPKTIDDKNYHSIAIWLDLIIAGASYDSGELNSNELLDSIEEKLSIADTNSDWFGKRKCEGKIKTNFQGTEISKLAYKYNFAAVRIAYDLDWSNKPTNVRVLSSIPYDDMAEAAKIDTKRAKPTIMPDTPDDCRKDILINIKFITR